MTRGIWIGLAAWASVTTLACATSTIVSEPGLGRMSAASPGRFADSDYAPVNERSRPGVVKYLNAGADSVIRARRKDAYKRMHDACGGPYRIDAEGPREEGGVVAPLPGGGFYGGTFQYWYIQFSCVDAEQESGNGQGGK